MPYTTTLNFLSALFVLWLRISCVSLAVVFEGTDV